MIQQSSFFIFISGSDESDALKFSLNVDPEVSSLLTDMPKSLRKKYLASLNQNMTSGGYYRQSSERNKTSSQKYVTCNKCVHNDISSSTKCGHNDDFSTSSTVTQRNMPLKCSKILPQNGLCTETLNEDVSVDSDSSGGIEITAL